MQPNPQIFQSQSQDQILPPNPQIQLNNNIPPNNMQQIVQIEAPNKCEKCSRFFTGNTNIPITVFIILMSSFAYHICTVFFSNDLFSGYFIYTSFFDFLFALLVWSKMAMKIEKISSTVKYAYLYLINLLIISIFTFSFPLRRIWNFVLFETILIANHNRNKDIKFFCCKIKGKYMIVIAIIYHLMINFYYFFSMLLTIGYAYIYEKCLINKLNISNERVQRYENHCIINWIKNKFQTFITLEEVLNEEKKEQGNNNINNNNIGMSFIPNNMYPNYYSGVIQGNPNQAPIQPGFGLQQNPNIIPSFNNINQNS